jgi:hypothetical protein
MTQFEKRLVWVIGIVILLLAAMLKLNHWWANLPPKRPANVPSTAGYYGGLATPFPSLKRGDWVTCWFDSGKNVDRCRVTHVDGTLIYEGVYLPYQSQTPIPQSELLIDSDAMNLAQEQVDVGTPWTKGSDVMDFRVVPLVCLHNGKVLIPEKAYVQGSKRLDELQQAGSPHTPKPAR